MRVLAGHGLQSLGMVLPGHGLRGGMALPATLRTIHRMFPFYLRGDRLVCTTPSEPEWHLAVAAWQGERLDCNWPTPGAEPTSGMYHRLDCTEAVP